MKQFKQGDIVVVPFPFSDLSSQKLRPSLVISNKKLVKKNEYIILAITGTIFNDNMGYNITNESVNIALPKVPSQIRCNKIFAVDKRIIKGKVNYLKNKHLKQVIRIVMSLIDLKVTKKHLQKIKEKK